MPSVLSRIVESMKEPMRREIRFGVFDHMDSNGRSLGAQFHERLLLAEAYDRSGFHAYHLAEHHATPLGRAPSPSVYLAAVAQRTTRLRFGPLVYALALHHPLRVLEEICMLDQMSGGRFELGVGPGVSPIELGLYGADAANAKAMYVEATEIILQGLVAGRVTFAGKFFQFKDVPLELEPVQRPHPPVWLGSSRPDSAAFAAGKAFNVVTNGRTADVARLTERYRMEWKALGKPEASMPLVGMSRHIMVASTDGEAIEIARPGYERWYQSLMHLWRLWGQLPPAIAYPETFEDALTSGFVIAGSPATVRASVAAQVREAGVNYFLCRMAYGEISLDHCLRSTELFAAEVLPAFAGEAPAAGLG
jgi:alkanesulfonate monooxygenase SsuD/methylene tetrahydromethanopterin reductase-like flavin-dependent oxidoreductase (luciferase family)